MNITILGCGVYGSAIASVLLENKTNVTMWNKFEKEINELKNKYNSINFTTNIEKAIENTDLIIIAIPVNFIESTIKELKPFYQEQDILIASKGIDTINNKFAYEIVKDTLNTENIVVISGGSFAIDMQNKKVLGLTLGTTIPSIKTKVKQCLENNYIKIQYTNDYIGVSICGSIKNVMAIGFGILDGANYPESSRFLFLTEAIYEIKKLIKELNGNEETIMTYAGIDDIMMTCTSQKSRNYTLGRLLGENKPSKEIEEYKNNTTIEGLGTSLSIYKLTKEKNIYLPITNIIYNILYENQNFNTLIEYLKNL